MRLGNGLPSAITGYSCTSLALLLTLGCSDSARFHCKDDVSCDLGREGLCLASSSGASACGYPDTACSSGYRYGNEAVGDGTCTEGDKVTLRMSVNGGGSGTVSASRTDFVCSSSDCEASFPPGIQITLTAAATSGAFLGWSSDCHGATPCTLTLDHDRKVDALFGIPGQALWVQQVGGDGVDGGKAIALDNNNDIIAVGQFNGMLKQGPTFMSNGGLDIYLLKIDGLTGSILWSKQIGGIGDDTASSVAVDSANNIYVAGSFNNSVNFGGGDLRSTGSSDAFVLKLNSNGDFAWVEAVGADGFDSGTAVAVRGNTVVFAGSFAAGLINSSITIGTSTLSNAGRSDIFVQALTTDGVGRWAKGFGGDDSEVPSSVAIDSHGDVVVTGGFRSAALSFGGAVLPYLPPPHSAQDNIFVAKLAGANGSHLVSKAYGSIYGNTASTVLVDATDNIFIVGAFTGSVDFGNSMPLATNSTNDSNVFVAKYTTAGDYIWAKSFGGTGVENAKSAALDSTGRLLIGGPFCGTISFGGSPLVSDSTCQTSDIFAAVLSTADGSHVESMRAGGAGSKQATNVALTTDGRFYLTGDFDGFSEFGGQALTPDGQSDSFIFGVASSKLNTSGVSQ